MKRLVFLALLATAACDPYLPPVIESFAVDDANPPDEGVRLRFSVRDAAIISIVPEPGEVTSSPVIVMPHGPTTYTLRAGNLAGWVSKDLVVKARGTGGATVLQFSVIPAQATAGTQRTMSWNVRDSVTLTLYEAGKAGQAVPNTGQMSIAPLATTTYTLAATSVPGFEAMTARAVARVVEPANITSFIATPPAILQGQPVTLSWQGNALSWSLAANGVSTNLGVARSLVVRPADTTTYTLTGTGPAGTGTPAQLTVPVTPRPGTTLAYGAPVVTTEKLKLVADPCATPCSALTLRLVAAAPVSLRGLAVDLPLDSTKASLDPATFATALDAGKAVLGSGSLRDTLVIGAARKGTGTSAAGDVALASGAELAHFVLALQPAGGQGIVFDGASAFRAYIQSASGRTPGGIAVGRLEAQ